MQILPAWHGWHGLDRSGRKVIRHDLEVGKQFLLTIDNVFCHHGCDAHRRAWGPQACQKKREQNVDGGVRGRLRDGGIETIGHIQLGLETKCMVRDIIQGADAGVSFFRDALDQCLELGLLMRPGHILRCWGWKVLRCPAADQATQGALESCQIVCQIGTLDALDNEEIVLGDSLSQLAKQADLLD